MPEALIGPADSKQPANQVPTQRTSPAPIDPKDHTVGHLDPHKQHIWDHVANSPIHNLWNFQGVAPLGRCKAHLPLLQ